MFVLCFLVLASSPSSLPPPISNFKDFDNLYSRTLAYLHLCSLDKQQHAPQLFSVDFSSLSISRDNFILVDGHIQKSPSPLFSYPIAFSQSLFMGIGVFQRKILVERI